MLLMLQCPWQECNVVDTALTPDTMLPPTSYSPTSLLSDRWPDGQDGRNRLWQKINQKETRKKGRNGWKLSNIKVWHAVHTWHTTPETDRATSQCILLQDSAVRPYRAPWMNFTIAEISWFEAWYILFFLSNLAPWRLFFVFIFILYRLYRS